MGLIASCMCNHYNLKEDGVLGIQEATDPVRHFKGFKELFLGILN